MEPAKINYIEAGKRIAEARRDKGLTQEDLCDKCGCSSSYLSRCERGKATIGLDLLYSIAVETGKSMDYFLMDSPKSNPDIKINGVLAELLSKCSPKLLMTIEEMIRSLLNYEDGMRGNGNGSC